MRALVIYESMYGNTRSIAESIVAGMADAGVTAELFEVGAAPPRVPDDVDLVVVGGPTHAFGLSRVSTRVSASERTTRPVVSSGIGIREWLEGARSGRAAVGAAAFDTRVDKPRVPGSAARAATRVLRRGGFHLVAPAETFLVAGMEGPLLDGEVERARGWAAWVADASDRACGQPAT